MQRAGPNGNDSSINTWELLETGSCQRHALGLRAGGTIALHGNQ